MPTIAIDLGTINTRVAVWQNGAIKVIKNELGYRTTPSFVAFTATERLIGDAAKCQAAMNAKNTVYDLKRIIGRLYNDSQVKNDSAAWSFSISEAYNYYPKLEVTFLKESKSFIPEEIIGMILSKMKENAEQILKQPITDTVITVPAFFSSAQRKAILDAGKIGGLTVVRLINETTAAALAYGLENQVKGKQTIFVYHLGGGTFDVSVIEIVDGCQFVVLAVCGDSALGGMDFDNRLVAYFAEEFERNHGIKIKENVRSMRRLRTACENLKEVLSTNDEAFIEVDNLWDDLDFSSNITRMCFEDLCKDLFQRTFTSTEQVLQEAKIDKSQINEVFLIGGSTRMPQIINWHESYFGKEKMNFTINAEEIVVRGAALQAAILTEVHCSNLQQVLVREVSPMHFKVSELGQSVFGIIKKLTRLPHHIICNSFSNGETVTYITIYEESETNDFVEDYMISRIPAAPPGAIVLYYIYMLDENGILTFSSEIVSPLIPDKLKVELMSTRIATYDMDLMIGNEKYLLEVDQATKRRKMSRIKLEDFILQGAKDLSSRQTVSTQIKTQFETMQENLAKELEWLDCNQHCEADIFERRLEALKAYFDEILAAEKNEKARVNLKKFILNSEKAIATSTLTKSKIKTMKRYYEKNLKWLENNSNADAIACEKRLNGLQHRFDDLIQQQKHQKELTLQLEENISMLEKQLLKKAEIPKLTKSEIEIIVINCDQTLEWLNSYYNDIADSFEKRLQNFKLLFDEVLTEQKEERIKAEQTKVQEYNIVKYNELSSTSGLTKDKIKAVEKKLDLRSCSCDGNTEISEKKNIDLEASNEELKSTKKNGVLNGIKKFINRAIFKN